MNFLNETDWPSLNEFCGSPFWDSNLTWYSDYPELTPCFEKTVFVWFPGLFLWIFTGLDIFITFKSKNRNIPWSWKNIARLIVLGLLITLCIAEFVYNINRIDEIFPVDLYTPLIKLVSLVLCITLEIYHRKYGQRVSGLLFIYWFLVASMGFPQFYTDITGHLASDVTELRRIFFIGYYSLCFIMFMLHWLIDPPPKNSEYPKVKNPNPGVNASFPSRLVYSWFDHVIYKGFKRPLTKNDLWSMNHEDSASQLYQAFSKYWNKINKKKVYKDEQAQFTKNANSVNFNGPREKKPKVSILPTLSKAFGGVFLFASFFQLIDVCLTFASPEILKLVINFVSADEPRWHGYFYAALMLSVNTLQSLIQNQYNSRIAMVGLRMRTSLTTAVYRKALKLSSSARKDSTLGEIVNLMAVDSQTFMNVLPTLNTLWSAPLQIALSLVFLWQQLGPSVLMGLGVMLIMIPANAFFANLTKNLQVKQMKYKDERIKTINEVLSGMKVLKLYGWEPSFEDKVLKIREKEAVVLKRAAYLRATVSFIWTCAPFLVSLLTFATYVFIDENNILDSTKVFVSLSLFNIMRGPLAMVPGMISNLIQTMVSIKRLNKFLNKDELDLNIISHDDKEDDPLVVEKGTFSWADDEEPTLRNLNLRVKPGSLVAVVGAVGSGKSSFISAFLGEMYKVSGRVNTKGSIAYVPQLAWIQNCTLQDNILFGKNLDNKRYHKVIEACALKADLEMLPGGDQTEIGERGINVSGGQKQRISLARAVYSDCDVYFLDDPLSAVDSHVGKHIFDNVISSSGVLKKKTRILVTHGITFLPEVDLIVVLKEGEISEVGTYRELLEKKGAFSEFLITHLQEVPEEELEEIDTTMKEEIIKSNPEFHRQMSISRSMRSIASIASSVGSVRNRKRRPSEVSQKSEKEKPKKDKLIVEEKSEEGRVKWTVYTKYFQAVGWFLFFTTAILSVANQALSIGSNLWLSAWSDDKDLIINGTQDLEKRNMYLAVYGLFGALQTIGNFFCSLAWYVGCVNAGLLLHYTLLLNLMRSPMSFFDTTPQGRILNRFSKEIDALDNFIPFIMKQFFSMSTPVVGILIVISYSTPMFMVLILPIGLLYYFLQKFYIASSQQLRRIESISRSPVFSHFSESVSGAPVIRAYCVQNRFIKESEMKIDFNQSSSFSGIIASRWLSVRLQTIGNLIIFFATLFAVLGKDTLSPGIVGLSVSYTLQITMALNFLVQITAEVENNIVAVERIKEYTITPQEAAWEITPSLAGSDWPQEGKVEFVDYQVRYREGLDLVLKGINLVIKGGEKIGIVGRTGAGKSSITLCLFRIIESAGGKILIDGVDIAKLGLHALRSRLTIIPQDPVLFSGSLRMNLDPFGCYSDEQVWRALEQAHLKYFVNGLPAGLQHEVTEGGENISVGQRQLICLARALLRKTKILILDEATAAVDLETDDFIQKTIRSEFKDCTVLTIAHRINTIMDSDRVLVLDQGRVVEFDSPSELLKDKSSIFHGMAHDAGLV